MWTGHVTSLEMYNMCGSHQWKCFWRAWNGFFGTYDKEKVREKNRSDTVEWEWEWWEIVPLWLMYSPVLPSALAPYDRTPVLSPLAENPETSGTSVLSDVHWQIRTQRLLPGSVLHTYLWYNIKYEFKSNIISCVIYRAAAYKSPSLQQSNFIRNINQFKHEMKGWSRIIKW